MKLEWSGSHQKTRLHFHQIPHNFGPKFDLLPNDPHMTPGAKTSALHRGFR